MKSINEPPIKDFREVGLLYPFACDLDGEKHWLCVNDMLEMRLSHPYWDPMEHFLDYLKELNDIGDLYEVTLPKLRRQLTQSSIVTAQRKKDGVCLQCGAKGTPGYPHSRSCKNNPNKDEEDEY